MKRIWQFAFVLFLFSMCVCMNSSIKMIPLTVGGMKFTVEVADTPQKRAEGLMFRENIPDDFGMLFIFESEDYQSFWMKNCKVSLDIIYLNGGKEIVDMYINVPPCKEEPCASYPSRERAQYVLELRGKRALELKLKNGDRVSFIQGH